VVESPVIDSSDSTTKSDGFGDVWTEGIDACGVNFTGAGDFEITGREKVGKVGASVGFVRKVE
jgi:hypothetical protein